MIWPFRSLWDCRSAESAPVRGQEIPCPTFRLLCKFFLPLSTNSEQSRDSLSPTSAWMRARSWLESPRVVLLAAVVAAVLTAPTLWSGFQTEDWVQRARVINRDLPFPWTVNLYGHARPVSEQDVERINSIYQARGWFPWVTEPWFDVSFWRPLSSLTHHLDYRLWPNTPWPMHLESILWYAALAAATAMLFRRTLAPVAPAWVAGLASILYAVDDAHGHAVGWLVNRNGVMATFFGVVALYFYDRWRRDGARWSGVLSPIALAAGLLSAEFALCTVGYLIAHAVFMDEAPIRQRLKAASTWFAVLALWIVGYRALGHGTFGSGLYVHPLSEPIAFFFELTERMAVLFAGQFGAPPADLWTRVSRAHQASVVFLATLVGWLVIRMLWPIVRSERVARFYALGLVLSLPTACATFPEDRLLFFAGIGAMPLVALFVARVLNATTRVELFERPRLAMGFAAALALLNGVVAPVLLPYRSLYMHRYDARMQSVGDKLYRHVTGHPDAALVIVNAEDFYFAGMIAMTRFSRKESTVERALTLAGTLDTLELTRVGPRTIRVHPKDGFMTRVFNLIYRGPTHPMRRGLKIPLSGIDIEVEEVNQSGEPLVASFEFAIPLDDPHLVWLVWQNGDYRAFKLPKVGETVIVRGVS